MAFLRSEFKRRRPIDYGKQVFLAWLVRRTSMLMLWMVLGLKLGRILMNWSCGWTQESAKNRNWMGLKIIWKKTHKLLKTKPSTDLIWIYSCIVSHYYYLLVTYFLEMTSEFIIINFSSCKFKGSQRKMKEEARIFRPLTIIYYLLSSSKCLRPGFQSQLSAKLSFYFSWSQLSFWE